MSANAASLDSDREFIERRRYQRIDSAAGMWPVDRNFLRRFTLGNRNLECEVLNLFAKQTPTYLANLAQAQTAKDWHDAAHALKGASRSIGAWRLARSAEMAEKITFATELDKRAFALDTTTEAANEVINFIAEIFPET